MKYLFLGFILLITGPLRAQLIQVYGFGGALGTEVTLPPNGQPANGVLSSIRRGSGISPNNASNAFGAIGFTTGTFVDTSKYFSFGLEANSGYSLKLDSVVVSERRSGTGIRKFAVRSSLDNFASDIQVFSLPDDANTRNNQKTSLGSTFQSIPKVEFRYFGYEAESESGSWRLDSIRIYGTITLSGSGNPTYLVKWQNNSLNIAEGNSGTAQLTMSASSIAGQVIVQVVQKSGTISPADYTTNPASLNPLTIPDGTNSFPISVNAVSGDATEGTESATWVIRTNQSNVQILGDSTLTLTITEPTVSVSGPPFTRTIAEVRGTNSNGAADSLGRNVRLFGTVYGVNQRLSSTGGGYQMYLRDATGGIGIFKTTLLSNVPVLNEGDSIRVMGKIEVFRGLSQINPDSMVVLATGRSLKTPSVVTTLDESREADLVRFNNVTLVSPAAWTTGAGSTGFTVQITDGTNTTDVRIDNDCPLYNQPAPTGAFDLIGMGSQFASSTTAPFTGGYQLIPRRISDLIPVVAVDPPCACKTDLKVFPNPGREVLNLSTKEKSGFVYQIFDGLGKEITIIRDADALVQVPTANWPAGVYTIRVKETGKLFRWVKP